MWKKFVAYLATLTLIIQVNAPTMLVIASGWASLYSSSVVAEPQSDTELLDELKTKYRVSDPYRNHQNTDKIYKTLGEPVVEPTRDLSGVIRPNSEPARTINLPTTSVSGQDSSELMSQFEGDALALGLSNSAPTGDSQGNLDIRYAKKGTRIFAKDANGKLQMKVSEESAEYVEGIQREDYLSSEINRSDISFNADRAYGDNDMILNEGKQSHRDLSTGTHASARAYQMVTQIADKGINTTVPENSAFLAPSRIAFDDVQSPSGGFFSACSTTTEARDVEMNFPTYEDVNCQRNTAHNLNFCEVSRELRIPFVIDGNNVSSCGPGCYQLKLRGHPTETDNYYRPPCGDKCGSMLFNLSTVVAFNLEDGFKLKTVRAEAQFDDHFELLIDGKLAFSQIYNQFSYSSMLPEVPPNAGRGFAENGGDTMRQRDVTSGFVRHINQKQDKSYLIDVNTLVGGAGEMSMTLQFVFEDETGEGFGEIVHQEPKGCLDLVNASLRNNGGGNQSCEVFNSMNIDDPSDLDRYLTPEQRARYEECQSQLETGGSTADPTETPIHSMCRFDGYVPTEVGTRGYPQEYLDYLSPFYPGDTGNKTWKMELENYRCDPLGGQEYCVVNAESKEVECYDWDELLNQPNQCKVYEDNPSCSLVSSECTEGWEVNIGEDPNGDPIQYCYNETANYQCETNNTITRPVQREVSSCAGALPCSGGDCAFGETESNTRFVEAAVQANILQQVDGDRFCSDNGDPSTCRIFTGEAEYCSWEVTGLGMDCCEAPGGLDILSYVMTANLMLKTNRMAADGLFGETAQSGAETLIEYGDGAYTAIKEGAQAGWNAISEPITSNFNSLVGNSSGEILSKTGEVVADASSSAAGGATEGIVSNALAKLQQEAYQLVYDMLPEELGNLLFDKVADEAAEGAAEELVLNEAVSSALQTVMAAYAIYSYVKLALTLLTMCDENEADMGIKLGQRQCFPVGGDYCSAKVLGICYQKRQDYCCYNSIFARIVMEQAGPMLGKDMTTCEGLTQAELGQLDFNRIDLSEWVGLMVESGSIKDRASEQDLTGAGQLVGSRCEDFEVEDPQTGAITTEQRCFQELEGGREINTYGRQNVSDRTGERMDGAVTYSEEVKTEARGVANNLDCSASPRPPVCEFQFDIRSGGGG